MSSIVVSELNTYPLKSATGIALDTMALDDRGPLYDRRWMLVDENYKFVTQRQYPKMCLIHTAYDNNGCLTLSAQRMSPISVQSEQSGNVVTVQVWRDSVEAIDCGDTAANWVSEFLGVSCRVVHMPDRVRREVNPDYASNREIVGFSDGFPLLLISQASLDDLNTRLSQPIAMNRFRANIIVTGCEAFAEDQWKIIRIGEMEFQVAKPCSRCVIPSIDPNTGVKQPEVVRTLAAYRRRNGKVYFGQNLLHRAKGQISINDPVEVVQ